MTLKEKRTEKLNEQQKQIVGNFDVSRSLFYLNAQVEMLDKILYGGGQITIRYIERLRKEHLEQIRKLINENCG